MKNNFYKIVLLTISIACVNISNSYAQENNNKMEKFNIDFFNKNRKNSYSNYTYKEGDTIITIQELSNSYKIIKRLEKSTYSSFKHFYKSNLSLKLKGQKFYDQSTGIWEYYDENGNLTKTVDKEVDFPFSFEDLVRVMKTKYDIDLMDYRPQEFDARRDIDPYPNYQVLDYVNRIGYEFNALTGDLISITNGKTGEVKKYSNPPKGRKDLSMNTSSSKGFWSTLFD